MISSIYFQLWDCTLLEWNYLLAKQSSLALAFPCIIMKMFVSAILSLLLLSAAAPPSLSNMDNKTKFDQFICRKTNPIQNYGLWILMGQWVEQPNPLQLPRWQCSHSTGACSASHKGVLSCKGLLVVRDYLFPCTRVQLLYLLWIYSDLCHLLCWYKW